MTYKVGITWKGWRSSDPVRHALTSPHISPWLSACEADIWGTKPGWGDFDPNHPRACKKCVKAIEKEG